MAANIHVSCIKCGKSSGTVFCNGCNKTLCFKHINEHSNEIEKEFECLINEQNDFENELLKKCDSHYLFDHIDQWKKESIQEIKEIAKKTKEDLKELISQSNEYLLIKSKQIKEHLLLLKQSEDLSEIELIKLSNEFNNLKKEINSFQLIKSSNSNFLKIKKEEFKQISHSKEQLFHLQFSPNIEENHSKREGSILIREIDPYGHFIIIEHSGLTTDKEQDMIGWTLKRLIDSHQNIIYRFPNDFILKSKSFVKILSRQATQTLFSHEKKQKHILIAESILTWGIGIKNIQNCLIDANGDEKHILTQIFHSFT